MAPMRFYDTGTTSHGARLWRAVHPSFGFVDAVDALRNVALFAGFGAVWLASSGTRRLR